MSCPSAISHRLKQQFVYGLEGRTLLECMTLEKVSIAKQLNTHYLYKECTEGGGTYNTYLHLEYSECANVIIHTVVNCINTYIDKPTRTELLMEYVVNDGLEIRNILYVRYLEWTIIITHKAQFTISTSIKKLACIELIKKCVVQNGLDIKSKMYVSHFEYPIAIIHKDKSLKNTNVEKYTYTEPLNDYLVNGCLAIRNRLDVTYLHHFFLKFNIQVGLQHNLWNGFEVGVIRSNDFSNCSQPPYSFQNYICNRMTSSSNIAATTRNLFEQNTDVVDTLANGQKRQVIAMVVSSQKKAKGKGIASQRPPFWLGFHTLNAIACEKGKPIEPSLFVSELVKLGMAHNEALEHLEAVPSFPYIPQEAWPSKREDRKEGGHFNLIQVPFDIETDECGFALDYQVAISFEIGEKNLPRDEIYAKTEARMKAMDIQLGEILGEPIAIICFHASKRWSGTIKLHLKNPLKDATNLLIGTRSFILKLDSIFYYRGKVFKSFDSIAIASLLSVKIFNPTLKGKKWFELHEEIVKDSFKREYEFEITNVQKNEDAEFAWVKTPSPEQTKKIKTFKISFFNEIMEVNFASLEKLSDDDKARKNAVVLIAKNSIKPKLP